jgi:hypothetical protein
MNWKGRARKRCGIFFLERLEKPTEIPFRIADHRTEIEGLADLFCGNVTLSILQNNRQLVYL